MATVTESAVHSVREYAEPLRAAVEENLRDVRRAVVSGRHAVEDAAAEASIQVRRHPFVSLAVAAGVGTVVGCALGCMASRFAADRRST
jgi:ElaB/YqjD/DUF883 family membrane-anchored ribosome-binding protein